MEAVHVTVDIPTFEESDIKITEHKAIEQIVIAVGNVSLWINTRDEMETLRAAIEDYLSHPLCELCPDGTLATTTESDELGNDLHVCDNHAEQLAARKPERRADEQYDQNHRAGA